ncbi:MAG: hypothetical protein AB1546_04390 [bacterium]
MMKWRIIVSVVMLFAFCSVCLAAKPAKITQMELYETHNDDTNVAGGSADDFIYSMVSVTKELQPHIVGNMFYMHRYDIDESTRNADIFGASYRRYFKTYNFALSYYFNDQNDLDRDADRFVLGLENILLKPRKNSSVRLLSSYTTQTDWATGVTLSEKLSYDFPVSKRTSSKLAYTYGYNLNESDQLYNQYNAALNYSLNKNSLVSLEFLFVDKVYSFLIGGINVEPDDDSVLRLSVMYTY